MENMINPKLRYNYYEQLHRRGREFYLFVRAKTMRKFGISANTWDLWQKVPFNAHWRKDPPAVVLKYIADELDMNVENLFNKAVKDQL